MTITLSSQGSLELSIVILPLQKRPGRRSMRAVQHHGPCQAEGHCGGVGQVAEHSKDGLTCFKCEIAVPQDGGRSEQEAGRYKNTLCILVDSAVVHMSF